MKNIGRVLILMALFIQSCVPEKNISVYLGYSFKKNDSIIIYINGEEVYHNTFQNDYKADRPNFVGSYVLPQKSEVFMIKASVSDKDTTTYFPSNTEKLMFGQHRDGDLYLYTEKDVLKWMQY